MRRPAAFILFTPLVCLLTGFGEPKNSKLEVQLSPTAAARAVEATFKVIPLKGKHVTDEGPWSLTLTKLDGLDLPAKDGQAILKDYDLKLPGFKLSAKAKPGAKSGELTYKLKAFVCEDDKSRCYAETHQGTLKWAAKE